MSSYLLTAFVLLMFSGLAAAVWIFRLYIQRRFGIRIVILRWLAIAILVFAIVAASFTCITDYRLRVTTLHEDIVAGTMGMKGGDETPVRRVPFVVEHPGVQHELFLSPLIGSGTDAAFDIEVSCRVEDDQGKALLDFVHTFQPGEQRSRVSPVRDWKSGTWQFTPSAPGAHSVAIRLMTTDIPSVHVRISDPAKRNGTRMPGY